MATSALLHRSSAARALSARAIGIVVLRALPLCTVFFVLAMCLWVSRAPLSYPWPLIAASLWFGGALLLIGWRRIPHWQLLERALPPFLSFVAVAAGIVLTETTWELWLVACILAALSYLVLELLFLSAYNPSRYPVNALSHVNLALVPIGGFFLAASLNALFVFLNVAPWVVFFTWMGFCALWYAFTSHPSADKQSRWRWVLFGLLVGVHVALFNVTLPLATVVQGALCALFLAVPLRIRRYGYQPVPAVRLAWGEACVACVLFVGLLSFARWS